MFRGKKRTFKQIRLSIILALSRGQKTTNQLAKICKASWKTVDSHIIYLIGRGLVSEVFSCEYVKIFELTSQGKEHLERLWSGARIEIKKEV